ncbi:MAG: cytochrome-c oxidase, cbb3-type subunit II [Chelatococcus sp.]|uniref:cytochrome-c oxidase, cbb3-type subunit II n=1 Tax=unclassified Chelatococcus TaxID=2638111 RepID=UPI001BCF867B|nr:MULTISPECIES: cytochrome-c oxidase, cbb3-type subunit II [unclassified Chelatococcus]CAH1651664.1 Cytochrome c oxidase subunit CcoO [Hyphomicrobiales bacterium]MBS7743138.1 cytochrome-c oxidase, cbb3-type subunit II [Chelatococcus sp. HY11]MBX3537923.1 cytochrome-c oxidase, cbb3-type subunit II [Chelatococcus sp.]MBX3541744.1 cytochrome-c oxidase, cbb3-type subunit II [Chelatococcus sp.]MCO5074364.1 cytochrome-c oxidase, cbb3-type subunit II [Chelatococcus sp.]
MPNFHRKLERSAIGFVLAIVGVSAIGGFVEIAPLFTIHETVEKAPDMRVYTPLEVAGRNIYIREGCYACHSQMIRTLRDEVERYGPFSLAVESQYDHPMLWGSKRTGPDLARVGGKYSDAWHVAHLINPRDVVPESVMPRYAWLQRNALKTDDLGLHLAAQRTVGVPYTDEMIANAPADAYGQANPDSSYASGVTARYGDATNVRAFDGSAGRLTEMDALVAYLQVLGRLTDAAQKTATATKE